MRKLQFLNFLVIFPKNFPLANINFWEKSLCTAVSMHESFHMAPQAHTFKTINQPWYHSSLVGLSSWYLIQIPSHTTLQLMLLLGQNIIISWKSHKSKTSLTSRGIIGVKLIKPIYMNIWIGCDGWEESLHELDITHYNVLLQPRPLTWYWECLKWFWLNTKYL